MVKVEFSGGIKSQEVQMSENGKKSGGNRSRELRKSHEHGLEQTQSECQIHSSQIHKRDITVIGDLGDVDIVGQHPQQQHRFNEYF
jgi:hypothetical protein